MQNFDDLDIEGRNPSHLSEADKEKEEYDRKRLMRSSVTAEDGTLRPVYSETEDGDIWCHICNIALFGAHKLLSHNLCNRHKIKLDEWPYPVLLWSKRSDIVKAVPPVQSATIGDGLAPGEPVPPGMEDQIVRTTTIQTSLDRHRSSPLVGLEYLLELVDNDSCEPSYTCVLCDKRGDPRTVMAHITSYNHRITYLNRHFPTISRAITELPRTPNYKRGANEISVLVAKKIEERFGRLQPQLVDKNQFEKNKMQYIKRVYQDYHFRETSELTFMDVYDVRWVTNFEEKMSEMGGNSGTKKDAQPAEEKLEDKRKSEEKKPEKSATKKPASKLETTKSGFKIRILTRDKLNIRKPLDKEEDAPKKATPKRPSDETKSLSSLSSISSSPSPSRSRSRSPTRSRKPSSMDKIHKYRSKSRYSRDRTRSHSRSRSRSLEPLRERDKWDKYRDQIRRAEEALDRALKFHEKNPEKHPSYPDEWKKFWNRRYKELQAEGKDPSKHDFKPEWIEFWNKRMREIHNEQLQQRKEEIRKRLELPEDKPPEKWIPPPSRRDRSPPKRNRHRVESDDEVEYVGTKTVKTDYYDRHEMRDRDYAYSTYVRGRGSAYRSNYYRGTTRPRSMIHYATPYPVNEKSPSPIQDEPLSEDLEVVGLLRLLTALEGQLGSLGPKIVSLLSKALAAEKAKPNSAEELLYDEEVSVLFETVKEKLKGQLFAGMIEKMAITPTKSAIQNIAQLLHKTAESKKKMEEEKKKKRELMEAARSASYITRTIFPMPVEVVTPAIKSEPVSVPGVGTVDKVAIAQQIAAALVAQGRSNVSQEELETLINAVVGMAEASKNSNKPVTTADFVKGLASGNSAIPQTTTSASATTSTADTPERQTSKMESLSDGDLKTLLQNFKELGLQEQHGLISFLKKLEATDPIRVEKLRGFVNLGTTPSTLPAVGKAKKSPTPDRKEVTGKKRTSISPFSVRKGKQNPADEEDTWKPKVDMFANDDDEEPPKKKDGDAKSKTEIYFSDDDDDYTFEDIYKAANDYLKNEVSGRRLRFSSSATPDSNDVDPGKRLRFSSSATPDSDHVDPGKRLRFTSSATPGSSPERTRALSRSPVPRKETKTNDPNAILNETKRLIANIMGELPNKYVPKSHIPPVETADSSAVKSIDEISSTSTAPMSNFYNQGYDPNNQQSCTRPQAPPLTYPNMGTQQFQGYPQQQAYSANQGYIDNGYNYQGYGNQGQYSGPPMGTNQYPSQQTYGGAPYGAHPSSYPQQQQPQQYDNYVQQQRFY